MLQPGRQTLHFSSNIHKLKSLKKPNYAKSQYKECTLTVNHTSTCTNSLQIDEKPLKSRSRESESLPCFNGDGDGDGDGGERGRPLFDFLLD